MKRLDPTEIEFGILLAIVVSALLYGIGSALLAPWREGELWAGAD